MKILAIIGLDYVGLPLPFEFGKSRPVIGFDIDSPELKQAQIFIVAVLAPSQFGHERGHAALVVVTTEGKWVLDMTGEPARKQDLPYRWVKIQQGTPMVLGRTLSTLTLLGLLVLAGSSGCAHAPPKRFIAGIEVQAPHGWIRFCRRNPTDVDCRGSPAPKRQRHRVHALRPGLLAFT